MSPAERSRSRVTQRASTALGRERRVSERELLPVRFPPTRAAARLSATAVCRAHSQARRGSPPWARHQHGGCSNKRVAVARLLASRMAQRSRHGSASGATSSNATDGSPSLADGTAPTPARHIVSAAGGRSGSRAGPRALRGPAARPAHLRPASAAVQGPRAPVRDVACSGGDRLASRFHVICADPAWPSGQPRLSLKQSRGHDDVKGAGSRPRPSPVHTRSDTPLSGTAAAIRCSPTGEIRAVPFRSRSRLSASTRSQSARGEPASPVASETWKTTYVQDFGRHSKLVRAVPGVWEGVASAVSRPRSLGLG